MRQGRAIRLGPEIDVEIMVDAQTSMLDIDVDLQEVGSLGHHVGVELLVPWPKQGVGHVQTLAIQAELQHLRTAKQLMALDLQTTDDN